MKNKNNKAQLQMTQNIVIIIIIVFIIIFGFSFYYKVRSSSLDQKSREYSELDAVKISQLISNLPEFSCSTNTLIDINCVDKLKLEAFINLNLTDNYYDYYRSMFGKSTIIIKEVYPINDSEYIIYNNTYNEESSYTPIYIPINVYDSIKNVNNFGYLCVIQHLKVST